ncbi:conserved Plasmodium protein, unknown function, partial [Plasmodium yoelii]
LTKNEIIKKKLIYQTIYIYAKLYIHNNIYYCDLLKKKNDETIYDYQSLSGLRVNYDDYKAYKIKEEDMKHFVQDF